MRCVYALFIVVSMFLVGCSGTPDQVESKTTSFIYYVDIFGDVAWDAIENPPVELEILVYMENGGQLDYEGSFFVSQLTQSYLEEDYEIHYDGERYLFQAVAPDGYTVVSTNNPVVHDPLHRNLAYEVNFTLEKD